MPERPGAGNPTLVWRSTALRLALAAAPAFLVFTLIGFSTPWQQKLFTAALFLLTLFSPEHGLLAAAALAPLGALVAAALQITGVRMAETIVVTFLAGWLLRPRADRPGPRVPGSIGWLFALTIVASLAVQAWRLADFPGALANAADIVFHSYFLVGDPLGLVEGARLLEGVAMAAAAVTLIRQRPRLATTLPVALGLSAAVAALSSVDRWLRLHPLRSSGHVTDVNAAGSVFALAVCLSLGMAMRERGRARAAWLASAALTAAALWLSGSRSGIAAAGICVALSVVWSIAGRRGPAVRVATVAATVVLGLAGSYEASRLSQFSSVDYRVEFFGTALRMVSARPLLGVGIGQYYWSSPLFLAPHAAWIYGFENAHNNFLQIAGELGLVGLALFLAFVGLLLWPALAALWKEPRDWRLLGATAGCVAFVATWLTGHPLLVTEVALPFWIQIGLASALGQSRRLDSGEQRPAAGGTAAAALLPASAIVLALVAVVNARQKPLEPVRTQAVDGFYEWETAEDGTRYRWSGEYASVFVPADVTRVYLPVRMPAGPRAIPIMPIDVLVAGRLAAQMYVGASWADLNIELPDPPMLTRYKRIDLKVQRTWQPAMLVPGSADMRHVGVQVGEPKLYRER